MRKTEAMTQRQLRLFGKIRQGKTGRNSKTMAALVVKLFNYPPNPLLPGQNGVAEFCCRGRTHRRIIFTFYGKAACNQICTQSAANSA